MNSKPSPDKDNIISKLDNNIMHYHLKLRGMQFLATFIFANSLFIAATTAPAHAQAMREVFELPADCTFAVTSQLQGSPDDWKLTARLEHCDRIKRLTRLSETLAPDQRPRFYEGILPATIS